jgi:hypothetical protein
MSRQTLGQLARAHAEITDSTRHHRVAGSTAATIVTGPVLGPLAVLGALSKKSKAIAFVVFENGKGHQVNLEGNMQIRMAQSEVVKFNALAAAAAHRSATRASRADPVYGQKRRCRHCGHETTDSPDCSVHYVHVANGSFTCPKLVPRRARGVQLSERPPRRSPGLPPRNDSLP